MLLIPTILEITSWINNTYLFDQEDNIMRSQFQDNTSGLGEFSATISLTVKAGKSLYLEPELKSGSQVETLNRIQGIPSESDIANRFPES